MKRALFTLIACLALAPSARAADDLGDLFTTPQPLLQTEEEPAIAAEEEYANELASEFELKLEAEGVYNLNGESSSFAAQLPLPGVLSVILIGLIALLVYGRRSDAGSLTEGRETLVGSHGDLASRPKTARTGQRNPR